MRCRPTNKVQLRNLRSVGQTLHECREARTSYSMFLRWTLLRGIRKCRLNTEESLRNLEVCVFRRFLQSYWVIV